jgi:co-chaperonin GroES (HSP10)
MYAQNEPMKSEQIKSEMLKPLGHRVFVKLLPRYGDLESKLNLTLVDKKKHYDGVRRGVVQAVSESVKTVRTGETVLFAGDLGESFGMDETGANDGTDWRRLKVSEILAVEEPVEVA